MLTASKEVNLAIRDLTTTLLGAMGLPWDDRTGLPIENALGRLATEIIKQAITHANQGAVE